MGLIQDECRLLLVIFMSFVEGSVNQYDFMKQYLHRKKTIAVMLVAVVITASLMIISGNFAEARRYHTDAERLEYLHMLQTLPVDTNAYFGGSGKCSGCHGHDPAGVAFYTYAGEDVNIADDWAGTMMANAARDPLWKAKVSHEILVNPALQTDIENTCTRCHAPIGRFTAEMDSTLPYTMAQIPGDSLAADGINCSACHQIKDTLMGNNFTGDLYYTKKHVFGPYMDPFSAVMENFAGFEVTGSQHIVESELCGGCHTLITQSHDLAGNATGNSYFEQATYHEWKNSIYNALDSSCQSCHIPRITDSIDIATNYPFLDGRSPFGKHHLVGGNVFMLRMLRNNMTAIGATATPANYDTTIARTGRYLRNNTMDINLQYIARFNDTAFYDVELTNKAGHKFPSGYPSRISWVEVYVVDDQNDTIFWSGKYDGNGNVVNRDATYEPHYNVINSNQQVQIYEMVMGDVNANPTTVLERADTVLKDNRLAPKGFINAHSSIDTMRIYGIGNDADFNFSGPTEGTGGDVVHFHIPLNGYTGPLLVRANVWYHAVPRPWLDEMFSFNSTEIDTFRNFYNAADQTPSLVAAAEIDDINLSGGIQYAAKEIRAFPNPSSDGRITVDGWQNKNLQRVRVMDVTGREVMQPIEGHQFTGVIELPGRGVYLLVLETGEGVITTKVLWH